ncbi:hypothetical protein F5B21DRAFT_499657 [Xylaria acuta]|nr:hypothetical protein F5B21DRAFT_499657 [Xylaria acuta]
MALNAKMRRSKATLTILAAFMSAALLGFGYTTRANLLYDPRAVWAKRDFVYWTPTFTAHALRDQFVNPQGITSILLLIGGDIIAKAVAQLSCSFKNLPFTGSLQLRREIKSWVVGRLFRDLEKEIDPDGRIADHKAFHDSLHVEVYQLDPSHLSNNGALRPKRDLLWWSFVVALVLQIGIAIIPMTPTPGRQKPNFYVLLITVAGTLLSLITGSLQATRGEKYGRRGLGCRDMFALTKGNGYNIAIIILPNSLERNPRPGDIPSQMPYLANMATASYRPTKISRIRAFILGGLWIVLLLVIGGASADSWYLLLVGGVGMVHTVYVAGRKRKSEAHGIPLTRLGEQWVFNGGTGQMDVLVSLEKRIPGAGYLLRREFFNGPMTADDKARWKRFVAIGSLTNDEVIAVAEKQLDERQLGVGGLADAVRGHLQGNFDGLPANAIRNIVIDTMRNNMSRGQMEAITENLLKALDTEERMMRFIAARRATWSRNALFTSMARTTDMAQNTA